MADAASTEPAVPYLFGESVAVKVGTGETQRTVMVHASIIKPRSTFFASALSGRWESVKGQVELPVDDPAIFDLYLQCLYRNDASIPANKDLAKDTDAQLDDLCLRYCKMFVLADKLGDCRSANMILNNFIDAVARMEELLSPACLEYIFENAMEGTALRKVSTKQGAFMNDVDLWTKTKTQSMPFEYLQGVFFRKNARLSLMIDSRETRSDMEASLELSKTDLRQYNELHPKPVEAGAGKAGTK